MMEQFSKKPVQRLFICWKESAGFFKIILFSLGILILSSSCKNETKLKEGKSPKKENISSTPSTSTKKTIVVGTIDRYSPFSYKNKNGETEGFYL